jgi:hypothetical protein
MKHKELHSKFILLLLLGIILAGLLSFPQSARAAEGDLSLDVRHDHVIGSCRGKLILDSRGVRYETSHQKDARNWTYDDIKQWQLTDGNRVAIYSYEDRSKWRLGADHTFEFTWSDKNVMPQQLYEFLEARTKRPIEARFVPPGDDKPLYEFAVKHLGTIKGDQGRLIFAEDRIVYRTGRNDANRTWRYEDLESISSGGIYDLALTTYEQQRFHYASRHVYNFQLKQALKRDTYDELWRFVNGKKGLLVVLR